MISFLRQQLFDFEQADARRNALFLLLVAAIVSPDIPTAGPFPAVRLEQLLVGALLPSLFSYYRRHPELRRPMAIDWAFLALAGAILLSLILAPVFVEASNYSIRDPFELARVVEYWFMFRLAFLTVPSASAFRGVFAILTVTAIASGLFSVLQWLDPGPFNDTVTSIYAKSHNFDGLVRRNRTVGAVGNPNYFGIFSGLLLVISLALVLLRYPRTPRERWIVWAAVLLSTGGVVMSQSRTAALALLGAMFLAFCYVFYLRRRGPAYGIAMGVFFASLVISVTFVEVFPPKFGTFHQRFSASAFTDDPAVTIRLTKWKSILSGFLEDKPDRCIDTRLDSKESKLHEADKIESSSAPADVFARDAQRKDDISEIADAAQRYSCDTDKWPLGDLAALLVPKYLPAMPTDPSGEPYEAYLDKGGFLVGARLENATDPEGPVYALGALPNIITNPSFESGKGYAIDKWQRAGDVDGRPATILSRSDEQLFGNEAVDAKIGPTGSFYHLTVFDFPLSREYTASVWARSANGQEQTLSLYMIATLADGSVLDPLAIRDDVLPADGRWAPLSVTFTTTPSNRLTVLQFSLRAPTGQNLDISIDGSMVNEGPFPASFPYVKDTDPSRLKAQDLPTFSDSPLVGVGPQKEREVGAFDNEYILMLDRYGGLGTLAYLSLTVIAFMIPMRALKIRDNGDRARLGLAVLGLGVATYTVAQAVFNIAAGSYYSFQLMAIYWLLLGFMLRGVTVARAEVEVRESVSASTPAVADDPAASPNGREPQRQGPGASPGA